MSKNPSSVAKGMAMALARKTLLVTVASESAVTPTVQSQQAATVIVYRFNGPTPAVSAWENTQDRLSRKWSVTANRYAMATAANCGSRWTKSQIRPKSTKATKPPTKQNRRSLFASDIIPAAGCPNPAAKFNSLLSGSPLLIRRH